MRYLFAASAILAGALAGCGGSSSSRGPNTPGPSPTMNLTPQVATIPQTSPVAVKTPRTVATGGRHGTPVKGLPTVKPILIPTPTPLPASAFTARVYGTVRDARSHKPLAGAIVYVGYAPDRRTVTNAAGAYSIAFPAQRSFPVEVKRSGYVGYLAAGKLRPHGSYRLDVSLQRAGGTPAVPPPPVFFKG